MEAFALKGARCEELGLKDQAREAYKLAESLQQKEKGKII